MIRIVPKEIGKERAEISQHIERAEKLESTVADLSALLELVVEEDDPDLCIELETELSSAASFLASWELERMLSGPHDAKNAVIEINAGAGGTDAQDWAEMLLRLYLRWVERRGFSSQVLDINYGDQAGIKSASISVEGTNAFGYLRSERGYIAWFVFPHLIKEVSGKLLLLLLR